MDESIDTDDLIDLAAEYIAYLRIERGSSPRTIEAYEADLETYRDCVLQLSTKLWSQRHTKLPNPSPTLPALLWWCKSCCGYPQR